MNFVDGVLAELCTIAAMRWETTLFFWLWVLFVSITGTRLAG